MATRQRGRRKTGKAVADYEHTEAKRLNNPPAGLAREDIAAPPTRSFKTTPVDEDPRVPPELVWWGKPDSDEFEVEAPSIHIHEALTTEAIIAAAKQESPQPALFADPELDRSQQVAFYEHEGRWRNRLILGDSLAVMASLLERERLGGQVQMAYIDPPYGINYSSNFQARIGRTAVKDRDEDLTREPEQIQAYRDTWEKEVHSYLTYLRQRLLAVRDLLASDGSVFVQIGDEHLHQVRLVLDEVFGPDCFCSQISFRTKIPLRTTLVPNIYDHVLWYARASENGTPKPKFRRLFQTRDVGEGTQFTWVELPDGTRRRMTDEERRQSALLPKGARPFRLTDLVSSGRTESCVFSFQLDGETYPPPRSGKSWKTNPAGLEKLIQEHRVFVASGTPSYVFYADDYPVQELPNVWTDTQGAIGKRFVVQTATKVVERCVLMTTDPGDLVLDPTCGSGTTAHVAEKHGRRWITSDTSRVALHLARERLLTASFDYYQLRDEGRGVDAGLVYDEVPHVTLGSITRGERPPVEPLYDRPMVESGKVRVSGPFTVEALSRYSDNPFFDEATAREEHGSAEAADDHVTALLDALGSMGVPRRGAAPSNVVTLQRLADTGALHAEGTFVNGGDKEERFAVSLGPRHGPVTVQQIDEALADAYGYDLVVFAGFAATAEAQEYLRDGKRGRFKVALLEANADLLLADLLKNTKASQTFRLFSSPDLELHREDDGQVFVELLGMDTFDAATGRVESRERADIAAWFLDQAYDGLVFHVNQAFFTRTNAWDALGKALKDTVDPDLIDAMHSFVSLPFTPRDSGKIAVRVVDEAGQTSEAILSLDSAD